MILDACHSGAVKGREESGKMSRSMFDSLSDVPEGFAILSACGLNERSYEHEELGHGVFTFYLLKGAEGEADGNKDETVTLNELYDYVSPQVKNWVYQKFSASQRPHIRSNFSGIYVVSRLATPFVQLKPSKADQDERLRSLAENLLPPFIDRIFDLVTAYHEELAKQRIGPRDVRIGVFGPDPADRRMVTDWVAKKISEFGLCSITGAGYYLPKAPDDLQDISEISPPIVKDIFRTKAAHQYQYDYLFPRMVSKAVFYMNDEKGQIHQLRGCYESHIPLVGFIVHNILSAGIRDCSHLRKRDGYFECVVPDLSLCSAFMPKKPFCPFYDSIDLSYSSKEIFLKKRGKITIRIVIMENFLNE